MTPGFVATTPPQTDNENHYHRTIPQCALSSNFNISHKIEYMYMTETEHNNNHTPTARGQECERCCKRI